MLCKDNLGSSVKDRDLSFVQLVTAGFRYDFDGMRIIVAGHEAVLAYSSVELRDRDYKNLCEIIYNHN